jgi:hypothetical protein
MFEVMADCVVVVCIYDLIDLLVIVRMCILSIEVYNM